MTPNHTTHFSCGCAEAEIARLTRQRDALALDLRLVVMGRYHDITPQVEGEADRRLAKHGLRIVGGKVEEIR